MGLDIRVPIGCLFSILGGLLAVYGLFSNPAIYEEHSLGTNINLWWGLVMLEFGIIMVLAGRRKSPARQQSATDETPIKHG